MAPHPVRADERAGAASNGNYRVVSHQETRSSSTMSSLMCCTSTRSQKVMGYKESQKKFLWLDPNRWSGQKTVKKEKVNTYTLQTHISDSRPLRPRSATKNLVLNIHSWWSFDPCTWQYCLRHCNIGHRWSWCLSSVSSCQSHVFLRNICYWLGLPRPSQLLSMLDRLLIVFSLSSLPWCHSNSTLNSNICFS